MVVPAHLAVAAGTYDGWHEAEFQATYGKASASPAPVFDSEYTERRYRDGIAQGQQRHAARLDPDGKPRRRPPVVAQTSATSEKSPR